MSAKCATFVDNLSMPFDPEALTWTGLLTQWVQFAQATLALPDEAEGPRWRASTPAIINLQAVTFAEQRVDFRLDLVCHALCSVRTCLRAFTMR